MSIPHYPCAVEASRNLRLARKPLIIGDAEQPKRVLDCSFEASKQGIRQEMTIRKALWLCPDALVIPPDPVLYRNSWQSILDSFEDITPEIEDEDVGRAYLNVSGLQLHYPSEEALGQSVVEAVRDTSGLWASVGLAEGKFPALAAAGSVAPGQVCTIATGTEARFLDPLPAELLPVEADVIFRLRLLGLEAIGDIAALSSPELQSQFGFLGNRLWQLANGIDDEPLRPRRPAETLWERFSFETPVGGIEVMIAVARQLLSRLHLRLSGRAARELMLQAELVSGRGWERSIVLREAISETERLDFVLRTALQNAPPPNAVRDLGLRLSGLTGETGKQLGLGDSRRRQVQLEESIRQLKARYGYSPIYRCLDVESWSVIPEERQILVELDA